MQINDLSDLFNEIINIKIKLRINSYGTVVVFMMGIEKKLNWWYS